jgi:predicted Zn-dependent protease with MMP-like domain
MSPAEFERIARAALAELPAFVREHLANVVLLFEEVDPDDPDLYGLYDGVALPDREGGEPIEPARIHVYRRPLVEDFGDDPQELAEEVRVTVLHEIAHHFGIDEDRLEELGWD